MTNNYNNRKVSLVMSAASHNRILIDSKNQIVIMNILGDKEITIQSKLSQNVSVKSLASVMKYFDINDDISYLCNNYNIYMHLHRCSNPYQKEFMFFFNDIYVYSCYTLYSHLSQRNKFGNIINTCLDLIGYINNMSFSIINKKINFTNNKFITYLFTHLGLPHYSFGNASGEFSYIYFGGDENINIVFILNLNSIGNPTSYLYKIMCKGTHMQQVLSFDLNAQVVCNSNKKYTMNDILNNSYNVNEIYNIYSHKQFEIRS